MFRKPPLVVVTPLGPESLGPALGGPSLLSTVSTNYPSAGVGYYYPFSLSEPILAIRLWTFNGSAVAGNQDIGLYSADGTRLVSTGAVAQAGTNQTQNGTISQPLDAGVLYYLALLNTSTGRYGQGTASVTQLVALGVYQQASLSSLPATATFAQMAATFVPSFGLSTRSTV